MEDPVNPGEGYRIRSGRVQSITLVFSVTANQQIPFSMKTCTTCKGKGEYYLPSYRWPRLCPTCYGSGTDIPRYVWREAKGIFGVKELVLNTKKELK